MAGSDNLWAEGGQCIQATMETEAGADAGTSEASTDIQIIGNDILLPANVPSSAQIIAIAIHARDVVVSSNVVTNLSTVTTGITTSHQTFSAWVDPDGIDGGTTCYARDVTIIGNRMERTRPGTIVIAPGTKGDVVVSSNKARTISLANPTYGAGNVGAETVAVSFPARNYHVKDSDCGKVFSNEDAVDSDGEPNTIILTLPSASVLGKTYSFTVIETNDIIIDPNLNETIAGHAAGHFLRLDDVGCTVTPRCFTGGRWEITQAYDPNMVGEEAFKWE
jgi:hypothetical protein